MSRSSTSTESDPAEVGLLKATSQDTTMVPGASTSTLTPSESKSLMPSQYRTRRKRDNTMTEVIKDLYSLSKSQRPERPYGNKYGSPVDRQTQSDIKKTGLFKDIKALFPKHIWESIATLYEVAKQRASGGYMDDRKYLLERIVRLTSRLPDTSANRLALTIAQTDLLWNGVNHPPQSFLGNEFSYRMPDGSNNNMLYPQLGKAGTPYARSVKPMTAQPGALPDAGLLFDTLLARSEYKSHPNEISSILFYLATIVIHDLFRTSHKDPNITDTSSYLDLSPLYGTNLSEQMTIRTFKKGKIKPDAFCEKRVLAFPPGVSAVLVAFNRFHNYVVEQLAAINERGRFDLKYERGERRDEEAKRRAQLRRDEHLFQTGRLVTCGLYINIILNDYLKTILNLVQTDSNWSLDLRYDPHYVMNHEGTPFGVGNQVSVEFNLIYRWHSCVSEKDDKWTTEFLQSLFPKKDITKLTLREFMHGLSKWEQSLPANPEERTFGGLMRDTEGKYDDEELIALLADGIEDCAGAFSTRNVPTALRLVEILGIEQCRMWNCATLNELREFVGLKPYNTFEEVNSDPEIANSLKQLYSHPDFIEMYPGLIVEDAKPPIVPGSGLCPNFTISRAILNDAVSLVRGDRFYTVDYTASNLTNWGIAEVASDPDVDNGCVMHKLLTRAFPKHFPYNSIYAHYPFMTPGKMHEVLTKLGKEHIYSFDRPFRAPPKVHILSYAAATTILRDTQNFAAPWVENIEKLLGEPYLASDDLAMHYVMKNNLSRCLYGQESWQEEIVDFFEIRTMELLRKKSYKMGDVYMVDAVRDVGNILHTHFAAELLALPLKKDKDSKGIYTENELYTALSLPIMAVYFDQFDTSQTFAIQDVAQKSTQQLIDFMVLRVKTMKMWRPLANIVYKEEKTFLDSFGTKFIRRLLKAGHKPDEIVRQYIIPTAAASCAHQSAVFSQVLDFYLMPENQQHLSEIQRVAQLDTIEAFETLKKYALEGVRLSNAFTLTRRVTADEVAIEDMGRELTLRKDDTIHISFYSAGRDPSVFPDPLAVKINRPEESYIHFSVGPHQCLGKQININALTATLKVFARLPGLRRAPGLQGQLKYVAKEGGKKMYLKEDWSGYWPFPTTMKICFDELVV